MQNSRFLAKIVSKSYFHRSMMLAGRFLLVTFHEEQKREDCTVRADRLSDTASLIVVSVSGKISLSKENEKRHQLHIGRGKNAGD